MSAGANWPLLMLQRRGPGDLRSFRGRGQETLAQRQAARGVGRRDAARSVPSRLESFAPPKPRG